MDLIIHRKTQYFDVARPYKVYVDRMYKGKLYNGQTKLFSVEEGRHTVEVKQAFSVFKSKGYEISEDNASQVALNVSLSATGMASNVGLLATLLFFIVISMFSLNLGGFLFYTIPFLLASLLIAFFGFANQYLVITPSGENILLYRPD